MKIFSENLYDYIFEKWNIIGMASSLGTILFTHYEIMLGFIGSVVFLIFSVRAKYLQSKHEKDRNRREQELHELNVKLLNERIEQQEHITNDLKSNENESKN